MPSPTAIRSATSLRSRTDVRRAAAALCCVALAAGACGKRGSPLAPIVRIPAAITQITAARMGGDVYVTVTVPSQNIDASLPATITRIDVYGYTGRVAPRVLRFADVARVVASVPVAPPPDPALPVPKPPFGFIDRAGAWQGTMVTVRDTLTAEEFVQGPEVPLEPRQVRAAATRPVVAVPLGPLKRFYVAIPIDGRGRPGPPGSIVEFVLTALPDPPTGLQATYTDSGVPLTWEPSGGLLGFLLDRTLGPELAPFDAAAFTIAVAAPLPVADESVPPGPTTYNVYRELAPDPLAAPAVGPPAEWIAPVPVPINATPLAALATVDTVEFDRPRCYTVRAMRGTPPAIVTSEPSTPLCITPVDVFAPAPPTGLAAVPSEGGISLIWEPNLELDLGGYLVLRREGSDATLRQLTGSPIADARFRDTDVKPGARYTYSVVAVDAQLPLPNVSGESERVEEVAR